MKLINKIYNINSDLDKRIVLISDIHYSNKKDIKVLNYVLDNGTKIDEVYNFEFYIIESENENKKD